MDISEGDDDDDDDELICVGASAITQCPIMCAPLTDPRRNTRCGHVYSKAGIEGLLQQHNGRRGDMLCPVAGCSATVSSSTLKVDRKAAQAGRRRERRADSQRRQRESSQEVLDFTQQD